MTEAEKKTREAEKKARNELINNAFAGKTIQSINTDACNVWYIKFTDGTEEQLWAEQAVSTCYGSIPGIFMQQELANPVT